MNPSNLFTLLSTVHFKMQGNALFPTPPVPYADMLTLAEQLKAAIEAAMDKGLTARTRRNALVLKARAMLRNQANYVRSVCIGDAEKLSTSGFQMAKQPVQVPEVGIPQQLRARTMGVPGQVELRWRKVHGAYTYTVEQSNGDPSVGDVKWEIIGHTTRCSHVLTELKPYEACWFRLRARGVRGEGMPSDVVLGRAA